MASAEYAHCAWCEAYVRVDSKLCPECGLQTPVLTTEEDDDVATPRTRSRSRSRSFGLTLTVIAVPLTLSIAYAEHRQVGVGDKASAGASMDAATVTEPAATVSPIYADPLERSVWSDGAKSVQVALNDPAFAKFGHSFVSVSEGNIVSFCGTVPGTEGYGGARGRQRFISIFGQRASTVLEGEDSSFDVLWQRVCSTPAKPA